MKKQNILFIILAVFTLILGACGNDNNAKDANPEDIDSDDMVQLEYEPEAINPDIDVCELCAMTVADDQHATQIVLENDRVVKFDDIGCLMNWAEENGEDDIGEKFVRDFHTQDWVPLGNATYVFAEEIDTPMAYGIISFGKEADAESYIEDNGFGEILTNTDLNGHKWEMMGHDHGHDDHMEDHDEDHDEHDNHEHKE